MTEQERRQRIIDFEDWHYDYYFFLNPKNKDQIMLLSEGDCSDAATAEKLFEQALDEMIAMEWNHEADVFKAGYDAGVKQIKETVMDFLDK